MESLTDQTDQEIQLEQEIENQPLDFTTLTEAELEPTVGEDAIEALDSTPAPVTEEVVSTEPVTTEIVEETQPVQPVQPTQPAPVSETKEVVKPEPVKETATTEQVAAANLLVMSFTDDCWIQVKDASGKTLSTGVKKAGQSLNLSGNLPYSVILGAPENVSMTLASEPVDLSGYTSGKVARFNLP